MRFFHCQDLTDLEVSVLFEEEVGKFTYNKNKAYVLTEDTKDVENYVGSRIPMWLRLGGNQEGISEERIILRLTYFMIYGCVFGNFWKEKGADDVKVKPESDGVFKFTALKENNVLKQVVFDVSNE